MSTRACDGGMHTRMCTSIHVACVRQVNTYKACDGGMYTRCQYFLCFFTAHHNCIPSVLNDPLLRAAAFAAALTLNPSSLHVTSATTEHLHSSHQFLHHVTHCCCIGSSSSSDRTLDLLRVTQSQNPKIQSQPSKNLNSKPYNQTPNPKPQTPNPKPQTPNLKPQTPNLYPIRHPAESGSGS